MKKRFDNYRRLAKGFFSCSSLWAGPDHFVYVRGTGVFLPFVEEYKRFRFEDIHAITMAPTRMYLWTTVLYGLGAALSAALIFLPDYDPDGTIAMFVLFMPVLAVCLACFVVTFARGPSCRCRVETSVGSVAIRPLSRQRRAGRVLEEMSGLVEAVQGSDYAAGEERAADREVEGAGPAPPAASEEAPREASQRLERSVFLVPTCSLLAIFGLLWVVHAFVRHWWPLPILAVMDLVVFLGISVSLVQQMRGYTPGSILGVLWVAMAQQFILMGAVFLAYIYWSVQTSIPISSSGIVSMGELYSRAENEGVVYYFSVINGIVSMCLGLVGVALVWRHRDRMRKSGKPPALPPRGPGGVAVREEEGAP